MTKLTLKRVIPATMIATIVAVASMGGVAYGKEHNSKNETKIEAKKERQAVKDKKEQEKKAEKAKEKQSKEIKKEAKKEIQQNLKQIREERKQLMKSQYTREEMQALEKKMAELKRMYKDIQVIPVENILMKKAGFKFDTPPVIKSGRLLIPVRAITEGFGATVTWNGEEGKIIVSKADKEIVFELGSNKVYIDGVETTLDVPAEQMNNRTVVPFRFIVENLGLKVEYDKETGVIDIEDKDDADASQQA